MGSSPAYIVQKEREWEDLQISFNQDMCTWFSLFSFIELMVVFVFIF